MKRCRVEWPGALLPRRMIGATLALVLGTSVLLGTGDAAVANRDFRHGTIAAATNEDGSVEVFATDGNNRVWHRRQVSVGDNPWANWSTWHALPGVLRSIAAETNVKGLIELVGVNDQGEIFHSIQQGPNADSWSAWVRIDGLLTSVALARNADGRMELLGTNAEQMVWRRRQAQVNSGQWGAWERLDGQAVAVAAEANADGNIELFTLSWNGFTFHRRQAANNATQWSPWVWLPLAARDLSSIALSRGRDGRLELFTTQGTTGAVWHAAETGPNSDQWTDLGDFSDGGGGMRSVASTTDAKGQTWLIGVYLSGHMFQKKQRRDGSWELWTIIPGMLPSWARPTFIITNDLTNEEKVSRFLEGAATEEAIIRIAADVEIDLSGQEQIPVRAGVHILGERNSAHPQGPRLFTTTFPRRFLMIGYADSITADNVRISGLRIDGGLGTRQAETEEELSDAITIASSIGVEIDHNEIHGWRNAAVQITDLQNRIARDTVGMPNVHHNYFHHNQHQTGDVFGGGLGGGYGVEISDGSYASITRNAFAYNRHSIAGDGSPGSGYYFYHNLVTNTGGWNTNIYHTHQIDQHGTQCDQMCGPAGEYHEVIDNTILYTGGNAIKLRGTPTSSDNGPAGYVVHHNVFSYNDLWSSGWYDDAALAQTETGLTQSDNRMGYKVYGKAKCDFDGDGDLEILEATGVNWWLIDDDGVGNPRFMRASPHTNKDITALRDVNNDARCDVTVGTTTYLTGPRF